MGELFLLGPFPVRRSDRDDWMGTGRSPCNHRPITPTVPLNVSESDGRTGKDRRHLRRVAYASAKETKAALGMFADVEAIDRHKASAAIELMDRVCAMTWKLIGN